MLPNLESRMVKGFDYLRSTEMYGQLKSNLVHSSQMVLHGGQFKRNITDSLKVIFLRVQLGQTREMSNVYHSICTAL